MRAVTFSARASRNKSPRVRGAMGQFKLKRTSVEHVLNAIWAREAAAGIAFCRRHKGTGNVEGGGHGLRKFYLSRSSDHFQPEVAEAIRRWKRSKRNRPNPFPQYWQGHIRVAGLKQRDGKSVVATFPLKLVPPLPSPPPESAKEVVGSKLLKRVNATNWHLYILTTQWGGRTQLKKRSLLAPRVCKCATRTCSGQRKLERHTRSTISLPRTGGPQVIDWWEALDARVPQCYIPTCVICCVPQRSLSALRRCPQFIEAIQ